MYLTLRRLPVLFVLCLLLVACSSTGNGTASGSSTPTPRPTPSRTPTATAISTPAPYPTDSVITDPCPPSLIEQVSCQTPQSMRQAYGLTPLIQQSFTGKGQTIIDIVSFGSPTLQQDMNVFDQQFNLPPITVQQISPINEPISDPHNDRNGWAAETTLDVQIMHALAPGANIVVLTSPVAETEGTIGLPEFRQLLQYAIDHKLGDIVSNSWGASEMTLKDASGQAEIQKWDALLKQATTQDHMTLFSSSGDNGATDYTDINGTVLSPTPTTSFPSDDPWITSVGGTSLNRNGSNFSESAWNQSGGGFSQFFPAPTYQQGLPASVKSLAKNQRGVPDVSGDADPLTGLAMYENGSWSTAGGTSASSPLWSALAAIANQKAGHPLGFLNPALYQVEGSARYQQDFHDIIIGNNSVNNGTVHIEGYNAVPGWDAITGLGTPNGVDLLPDLIAASNSPG